jgi:HSP20 family protein
MRSDSSGSTDFERMIGKAALEAARVSSQASQAAKKILGDVAEEVTEARGYDQAVVDVIDADTEMIAFVSLPGAMKEKIDLRVTEEGLTVEAAAAVREGKYLRRETSPLGLRREIKLPVEIKPDQARASFKDGILEVHLPKLVVINAQRVQVE